MYHYKHVNTPPPSQRHRETLTSYMLNGSSSKTFSNDNFVASRHLVKLSILPTFFQTVWFLGNNKPGHDEEKRKSWKFMIQDK
jgi:hypothetical protein